MLAAHYNSVQDQKRSRHATTSHPPGGFSSYSDHKRVLTSVTDLTRSPAGSSENDEIDIIGIGEFKCVCVFVCVCVRVCVHVCIRVCV